MTSMGDVMQERWRTMHPEFEWVEEFGGWLVKDTEHWRVLVMPMIYNDRVVIKRHDDAYGYTAGWCYDKGLPAFAAAMVWDPETEVRPVGFKKEACDARRGALL